MLICVESRASNLFMKRCIRLNLQGKVAQFLSRGYVALLGTTGYKLLYSSRIRMVSDLAAQQQNKVINFRFVLTLVCFSASYFQIFCHWLARSTQKLDFLFNNSGLEYYTAMSCFSAQSAIRAKTEPGIQFQQPSLIKSQVPLFFFTNMSRKALFLHIMSMCDENIINLSENILNCYKSEL